MANYNTLKSAIQQAIKQNGNNEITGNLLQQSLLSMINSLGTGYQFMGVATPSTNPGTPDQNVFYIAATAGAYSNFGSIVLEDGEVAILKGSGSLWTKETADIATASALSQLGQIAGDIVYGQVFELYLENLDENEDYYVIAKANSTSREVDVQIRQGSAAGTKVAEAASIRPANSALSGVVYIAPVSTNAIKGYAYVNISNATTHSESVKIINKYASHIDYSPVINEYLNSISNTNPSFIVADFSVQNKYVAWASGTLVSSTAYDATDFIDVIGGQRLYYKPAFSSLAGIAFYDSNKIIIFNQGASANDVYDDVKYIDIPQNARYMRASRMKGYPFYAFYNCPSVITTLAKSSIPISPCDYKGCEIGIFDNGVCIGDSLTAGVVNYTYHDGQPESGLTTRTRYSYPTYLKKISGVQLANKGISGDTSFEWYAEEGSKSYEGYDFAIIQLGVNDAIRNMANYGTAWSNDSEQGFTNIINKLKNENNNIKIFVATIIPATSYSSEQYVQISQSIRDFVAGLNDANVILLDMQAYGHTADSEAYNCGHLSAMGYFRLAEDYKSYISYYIANHLEEFRQVQFIGSTYEYRD